MTVWSDAKTKRTNRRNAGNNCLVVPPLVTHIDNLTRLAIGAAANNTQNTYVVAYLASQNLYMGVGIPQANRGALALQLGVNVNAIAFLGRDINLHAEMAVVRYVCTTFGINKANLAGDLTVVCTGKPVCADCCGWMTKHGIGHGPVCSPKGSSQGWMNPLTGATFRGEKDEDFTYSKPSKYKGSATYLNPNPPGV